MLLLTSAGNELLFAGGSSFDEIIFYDDGFEQTATKLAAEQLTQIIDLSNDEISNRFTAFLKGRNKFPAVYRNSTSFFESIGFGKRHNMQRYLDAGSRAGVQDDRKGLQYAITANNEIGKEDIPTAQILGYVAIVADARNDYGALSEEELIWLCKEVNHPIIIIGEAANRSLAERMAASDEIKIYNAVGKFNFNETADLIRKAKLVITPYSIFLLLAASFKKRLIEVRKHRSALTDARIFYADDRPLPGKEKAAVVQIGKGHAALVVSEAKRLLALDQFGDLR